MNPLKITLYGLLFTLSSFSFAQNSEWEPVTGKSNLRDFVSDKTIERKKERGQVYDRSARLTNPFFCNPFYFMEIGGDL